MTYLTPKVHDIGHLMVGRLLPHGAKRTVGPFVFFDHIGPAVLPAGVGIDVRPHPHIGLATMTYLFEGELDHRDSLGCHQVIQPGAINWMTAGRGIVHSERHNAEARARDLPMHGIQVWIGLPKADERCQPSFRHYDRSELPSGDFGGATVRVVGGEAYGMRSPLVTHSALLCVDIQLPAGVSVPLPTGYPERACFVASGEVEVGGTRVEAGTALVVAEADTSQVTTVGEEARVVLFGGDPLDGPRYLEWNFVASDKGLIAQAREDWKAGRFPKVPGDDQEFIPLPE